MISTMRLGVADLPPKPVDSMKLAKRVKRELGIRSTVRQEVVKTVNSNSRQS